MKFTFDCLSAVLYSGLVPGLATAKENEQHFGSTSAVISKKNSRSSKENIYSSSSPFSRVKVTDTYKRLSHQAFVRDDTHKIENDKSISDGVSDGDGVGGIDNKMKLYKKEGTGTYMVVSAVAVATTAEAVSGEEVCVPPVPVPVAKSDKLDAGDLPLSSCSSKKHVCINSNNKKNSFTSSSSSSFQEQTGVCFDIWALPQTYMDRGGPRNKTATSTSTYWEDASSNGSAASYFRYLDDDVALYTKHHGDDEAGSYVDTTTGSSVSYKAGNNADDPNSSGDGSKKEDSFSIHGEDPYAYSLFGYYLREDDRHLKELSGTSEVN